MSSLTQSLAPYGRVRTHELDINYERRFAKGFNLAVAYTKMHARSATAYANEFDAEPTWQDLTVGGAPHRLIGRAVVDLPFGKGRALARSGILSRLIGGFTFAGTYEFQSGNPITFGNLFYYGNLEDITKGTRTLDRWFNTDNFERNAAKAPAAFHRRVFPFSVEGLRADGTNQWNVNAARDFKLRERATLQLRMDAINLANRSLFNPPNTTPTSSDFGRVTGNTSSTMRHLQFQARLQF